MKLTDLNAKGGIGANCLYLELGPFRFVIDAGIDPKSDGVESTPRIQDIPSSQLDFIILTHCHLDHLGSLPLLSRKFPDTDIYCSRASSQLIPIMLNNSYKVMKRIREERNIAEYPLYNRMDIKDTESALRPCTLEKTVSIHAHGEELQLTFYRAGHIPGATALCLEYKHRKIFFTGDILFSPMKILKGAKLPQQTIDTLILETTRGATENADNIIRQEEVEKLVESIDHTIRAGGTVLIPAFALGRMQEIMTILQNAMASKDLTRCPVYAAGLGMSLCDTMDQISSKSESIQFQWQTVKDLKTKKPNWNFKPGRNITDTGIYVLGSGMLVAKTPSYKVAASLLEHPQNKICFVGYCDPDTPGGQLLATPQGENFVFADLDYVAPVRAKVERFDLSGHANREELLDLALRMEPRSIILTHGDEDARNWFEDELIAAVPKTQVLNPEPLQEYLV